MMIARPPYRLAHLMILVAMVAGFFAALPPAFAADFTLLTLIAVAVVPTYRPESCLERIALAVGLVVVEGAAVVASIAFQAWLDRP